MALNTRLLPVLRCAHFCKINIVPFHSSRIGVAHLRLDFRSYSISCVGLRSRQGGDSEHLKRRHWHGYEKWSNSTRNGIGLVGFSKRLMSTEILSDPVVPVEASTLGTPYIPEPPPVPPDILPTSVNEIAEPVLNALGEPTLESLGLGGWWPPGMIQQLLEYMHVTGGLPWWETIVYLTIAVRILVFPLVINAQKNAAHMNNNMPQMQVLQMKLTNARQSGNVMESARYANELVEFMKEKKISPFKSMIVPLAQAPVFISVFLGLRRMANYPVESLSTGGMWWFQDLTVPDPYYILPLVTCATMFLTIKLGSEGTSLASQNAAMARYILKGMPIVLFPFIMNFPGAILIYWVSTNFISLIQVSFLRIPAVRAYFRIPKIHKLNPDALPMPQKSFGEGIKESWSNMKVAREMGDRQRLDEMKFRDAGTGPLVKTYKYDPTKQKPGGAPAIALKSRES